MTTYPHELTECENCGSHYCMGCMGEDCPNCKLQEVAFYGISLENKLEAVKTFKEEVENNYILVSSPRVPYMLKRLDEILEAED